MKRNHFLTNTYYLTLSTLVTQVIAFVIFIYVSKVIGPDEMGQYYFIISTVTFFAFFSLGGINDQLVRASKGKLEVLEKKFPVFLVSKIYMIILSIICCVVFSFVFSPISVEASFLLAFFSLNIFFDSLYQFFGVIFKIAERMEVNAILNFFRNLFRTILFFIFAHFGYSFLFLFSSFLILNFFFMFITVYISKQFINLSMPEDYRLSFKIIKQALILSVLSFTGFLYTGMDLVMLPFLTNVSAEVGIYSFAHRINDIIWLIRGMLATALYPYMVRVLNENALEEFNFKKWWYASFVVLFLFISCYEYIEILLVYIIESTAGESYTESAKILMVLILSTLIIFPSTPYLCLNIALGLENYQLILQVFAGILNFSLNILFFNYFGLIGIAYSTFVCLIILSFGALIISQLNNFYIISKSGDSSLK